ncbi:hypothetical protein KIW84_072719 [Lathyrus oleraceus]|uniref:ATP-dependent DNA helicase n=1 Tax=Pisum sativum TaxID=3888 RepID=A0A9D4VNW2_PEA|nr:hypothetical protein KIW84_072719 [Pisum sativum]
MTNKNCLEALDLSLQDICSNNAPFGGKVLIMGGDFCQVLPVVRKGTKAQMISACIVQSHLWDHTKILRLYQNMRSLHDQEFAEFFIRIGDGVEPTKADDMVRLHSQIAIPWDSEHSIQTPTRPTHKAGKGISRRIESVASQKEVPGRKLKKAGKDIPTTSGTKSQIMMRLEKMVEESDIMHGAIRSVDFDEGVFGIAHSEIIAKEDMQQLFEHEELGIAVIHTYIWYMYVTLMRGTELCNRFNFIAASRINTTFIRKNPTSVKNELVDRFMAAGDNTTPSLYFLPFNSGNGGHWVLVAMDLSRLMVYYLDSLSGDWSKYPSMKKTVDACHTVN